MKNWLFLNSGKCSPSYNMALDEALLEWHSRGEIGPVLRFYEWEPATLSIGYFQRIERDIDLDQVNQLGIGLVRRPTGGRGVLHEQELTYSIIVRETYPNMPESVTESYRILSEGLLQGFKNLGLDAYFAVPRSDRERTQLRQPNSGVCFDAPSWYELVVEGRKVAGSAQTRQKGVILQHGSILLHLDDEKLVSLFKFSSERIREKMRIGMKEKAVAIDELAKRKVSIDEAEKAFHSGFEEALQADFKPLILTDQQQAYVKEIEKRKYANDEWTYRM